jgi:Tfp pilus assembly protein PilF
MGEEDNAANLFSEILARDPGYIGSYYHLAKLYERLGKTEDAIRVYEKGMDEAKKAGDNHALGELRGAYEELTF